MRRIIKPHLPAKLQRIDNIVKDGKNPNNWSKINLEDLDGAGGCLIYNNGKAYVGELHYGEYPAKDGSSITDLRFVPEHYNRSSVPKSSQLLVRNGKLTTYAVENITRAIAVVSHEKGVYTIPLWDSFKYDRDRVEEDEILLEEVRKNSRDGRISSLMNELRQSYRDNKHLRKMREEADQEGLLDEPCTDLGVEELARLHDVSGDLMRLTCEEDFDEFVLRNLEEMDAAEAKRAESENDDKNSDSDETHKPVIDAALRHSTPWKDKNADNDGESIKHECHGISTIHGNHESFHRQPSKTAFDAMTLGGSKIMSDTNVDNTKIKTKTKTESNATENNVTKSFTGNGDSRSSVGKSAGHDRPSGRSHHKADESFGKGESSAFRKIRFDRDKIQEIIRELGL